MTKSLTLHHVSPVKHRNSIARHGLLTTKSTTKLPGVWLCSKSQLDWAIAHIAAHKGTLPWLLDVWLVRARRSRLRRIRTGIYVSLVSIPVFNLNISNENHTTNTQAKRNIAKRIE